MEKKQLSNMEIKKNNRNRIFRYIRSHGTVSNPDIAYKTKISLPTVTQITKELIGRGLVEESGELQSTGGRRAKALSIASWAKLAVGLDLTKNHIGLVLIDLSGNVLNRTRVGKPFVQQSSYYQEVNELLEDFLDKSGADRQRILGLGISFPGIVNLDRQTITYSHALGIRELPFEMVSAFFPCPCFFLNDANAGAYGEGIDGEQSRHFFYLSLSNTVGGSLFAEGELIQGQNFRCGEAGHMTIVPNGECCYCGKQGCLDAYCNATRLSNITEGKLELFFTRLAQGDPDVTQVWEEYTDYLAIALNNIHMLLDCEIVLGGYVGNYIAPHLPLIRQKVAQRNTFGEEGQFIKESRHKTGTAALGAAMKVMETFIQQI